MPFVFSTFFEWWYDSGTPEVRMRYAANFVDLEYNTEIVSVVRSINWWYNISLLIFIYI